MKEFFTIGEAAAWISKCSEDDFSRDDVLRANEEGRAPIYFVYKGNLGIFPDYTPKSLLVPKPKHRIYFKGILKSQRPCERGVEVENIRLLKKIILGTSKNYIESKTTKSDILRPHKVDVFRVIYSDPDMSTLDKLGTFFGRISAGDGYLDSAAEIPESEWLFHISDLRIIAGLQQAPQMLPTGATVSMPPVSPFPASAQEIQPDMHAGQHVEAPPLPIPGKGQSLASQESSCIERLKKSALVAKYKYQWPTVITDIADGSRNGLNEAKLGGGFYDLSKAIQWAKERGKFKEVTLITTSSNSILNSPASVIRRIF